jgi:hypothetical protein
MSATEKDLVKQGFGAIEDDPQRMLCAVDGLEKTGKNNFAFTFPDPIAVLNLDFGLEGMVKKFQERGKVIVNATDKPIRVTPFCEQAEYKELWDKSLQGFKKCMESPDIRTLVVDTASDWWDLLTLSLFGKLEQIPQLQRVAMNKAFRSVLRSAFVTDKSLVLIHRQSKVYKNIEKVNEKTGKKVIVGEWTGEYKRSGFSEMGYIVQANFITRYEDGNFILECKDSRHNMMMAGYEWRNDDINFEQVYGDIIETA